MPKRKVHFYRAYAGLNAGNKPVAVPFGPALAHLADLGFDAAGRYLADGEENALCAWPGIAARPFVSFGLIRRSELPEMERAGALEPLGIPENAGIVEQTHFVFFPDNIVGSLFNFYGPRPRKLAWYLRRKYPGTPINLRFDPLLRQDILEQLDAVSHLRVLKLGIHRSFVDRVAAADESLGRGFRATLEASDAEIAEIILRPRPRRRNMLADALKSTVKVLAREHDLQDDVARFEVQAQREDGGLEWIDVLKDRFIVEREVETIRGRRAVTPESAYGAIESAYEELREQLIHAAQIW